MPNHPDAPVCQSAIAPVNIDYNGVRYTRLGNKNMNYVSKFHTDVRGFWLLASLYHDAATDMVLEYTCENHITQSDFKTYFFGKLFKQHKENEIITNFQTYNWGMDFSSVRYGHLARTMIYNRMKFLNLKNKKFHKKGYNVIRFQTSEDYAQFRLYFSDYFVG